MGLLPVSWKQRSWDTSEAQKGRRRFMLVLEDGSFILKIGLACCCKITAIEFGKLLLLARAPPATVLLVGRRVEPETALLCIELNSRRASHRPVLLAASASRPPQPSTTSLAGSSAFSSKLKLNGYLRSHASLRVFDTSETCGA